MEVRGEGGERGDGGGGGRRRVLVGELDVYARRVVRDAAVVKVVPGVAPLGVDGVLHRVELDERNVAVGLCAPHARREVPCGHPEQVVDVVLHDAPGDVVDVERLCQAQRLVQLAFIPVGLSLLVCSLLIRLFGLLVIRLFGDPLSHPFNPVFGARSLSPVRVGDAGRFGGRRRAACGGPGRAGGERVGAAV